MNECIPVGGGRPAVAVTERVSSRSERISGEFSYCRRCLVIVWWLLVGGEEGRSGRYAARSRWRGGAGGGGAVVVMWEVVDSKRPHALVRRCGDWTRQRSYVLFICTCKTQNITINIYNGEVPARPSHGDVYAFCNHVSRLQIIPESCDFSTEPLI